MANNKPEYANWISKWIPLSGGIAAMVFTAASILTYLSSGRTNVLHIVLCCIAMASCLFTIYMATARAMLSYHGGNIQSRVLDSMLSYLDTLQWDGDGALLDIGCGSGAMSIKAAKKFYVAKITGIDYWGKGWDYSQQLCQRNAELEGVAERITFRQGDAAKLPFADGTFAAAVSNFVFHEVRTQPDKLALVREALRVIKPGGCFVFQDIFFAKSHYGDIAAFVNALEPYVSEIHFVDTRHPDYASKLLDTPLVLGQMGLVYGKK